ncbi:hypothetical protein BD289DRAFT_482206 [Coniella lustricola]|uniref:Uncharacterized protein n=1 Tax=Coniella lustricola TaxID=2025994 RepID=A0A2T3A9R2_9PEZI|nr:hypothetical protein BD289DRAFT_482206 [Coniella lustricola]
MSSQLAMPLPISPARGKLQVLTSQDFASLHATLSSQSAQTSPTPIHEISAHDYWIPAPPPPSPTDSVFSSNYKILFDNIFLAPQ